MSIIKKRIQCIIYAWISVSRQNENLYTITLCSMSLTYATYAECWDSLTYFNKIWLSLPKVHNWYTWRIFNGVDQILNLFNVYYIMRAYGEHNCIDLFFTTELFFVLRLFEEKRGIKKWAPSVVTSVFPSVRHTFVSGL
jgi:hypothetical protein